MSEFKKIEKTKKCKLVYTLVLVINELTCFFGLHSVEFGLHLVYTNNFNSNA